jgi:steroid 5-alpha reductase family enzyme
MYIFLINALAVLLLFFSVWIYQLKSKNAGEVDIIWAFSFPLQALVYTFLCEGFFYRKLILVILVCFWGFRLGYYLFKRNVGKPEDPRYHKMRLEAGKNANAKFLYIFLLQAVLSIVLAIPFFFIAQNSTNSIHWIEIIGIVVMFLSVIGEAVADNQLKNFKKNISNSGKVCDKGLWNYSRHPNYFFEWSIWLGLFVFASTASYGIFSVLSPILMYHFLVNVTGIFLTEEHLVKSRGQAYIDYQKSTSPFIPWLKKK